MGLPLDSLNCRAEMPIGAAILRTRRWKSIPSRE
jgi:hypothetical protein